jgi:hypothetical protein
MASASKIMAVNGIARPGRDTGELEIKAFLRKQEQQLGFPNSSSGFPSGTPGYKESFRAMNPPVGIPQAIQSTQVL